jgi:hypothetical protein
MMSATARRNGPAPELGQVSILPLSSIRPSPENDQLYRPVSPKDPDVLALAESVKAQGVLEPLVVTEDHYILSGHRRYVAAGLAEVYFVPCRVVSVRRGDGTDPDFLRLLREYNRQRVKTLDEVVREEIVSSDPAEAHRVLTEHHKAAARVVAEAITIVGEKRRARITKAKEPFLAAITKVHNATDPTPMPEFLRGKASERTCPGRRSMARAGAGSPAGL